MEIVIKIPKEFEEHFNSDRFEDSLQRCRCDIKRLLFKKYKFSLSGKYEIETLDMLTDAFLNATPLQSYGELLDKIKAEIKDWQIDIHDNENDAENHDFVFERIYEIFDEYKEKREG